MVHSNFSDPRRRSFTAAKIRITGMHPVAFLRFYFSTADHLTFAWSRFAVPRALPVTSRREQDCTTSAQSELVPLIAHPTPRNLSLFPSFSRSSSQTDSSALAALSSPPSFPLEVRMHLFYVGCFVSSTESVTWCSQAKQMCR